MNQRERILKTLLFDTPDRIPFSPGNGRESTLKRWHAEGLPPDTNPVRAACTQLGIPLPTENPPPALSVDFRMMPQFEEKILNHRDGHYHVQDWKGNICEISDCFDLTYLRHAKDFVTRRWIRCPVENRSDWEAMKSRYDSGSPERFPADFAERCRAARTRESFLGISLSGPFWQMREWCGFEGLCMLMIDDPELVDDMARFWMTFVAEMLERVYRHVTPDTLHISEDMAYKAKAMISMDMARRFCLPSWVEWSRLSYDAGVPLVGIDSDGYIGELIPLWIEAGINYCDPVEVAAHCDIVSFRQQFGHRMAYRQGVDKRCIAQGGKAIRDELARIAPVVRDGGYIPGCDHGVPADVSWENFLDYCRELAKITGWL